MRDIPRTDLVLEHGCSIGIISEFLAKRNKQVFGIDKSFFGIQQAKRLERQNVDYFVSDSLNHPFGRQKFGLVVALNLLELIEPMDLLEIISKQTQNGFLILSDPYDFDRGQNTVKKTFSSSSLRKEILSCGFQILKNTKKPASIPWNLNLNPRTKLHYKVDLIIGKMQ